MLSFRKAKGTDLSIIHSIEKERFGLDAFHKRQLLRLINNENALFLLATESEQIAGYFILLFRKNSRQARLYSLAVAAQSEGKGVGQQIMAEAEKKALQKKCNWLKLEVRIDNARAIQLYKRIGYTIIDVIPNYYNDGKEALVMKKELIQSAE